MGSEIAYVDSEERELRGNKKNKQKSFHLSEDDMELYGRLDDSFNASDAQDLEERFEELEESGLLAKLLNPESETQESIETKTEDKSQEATSPEQETTDTKPNVTNPKVAKASKNKSLAKQLQAKREASRLRDKEGYRAYRNYQEFKRDSLRQRMNRFQKLEMGNKFIALERRLKKNNHRYGTEEFVNSLNELFPEVNWEVTVGALEDYLPEESTSEAEAVSAEEVTDSENVSENTLENIKKGTTEVKKEAVPSSPTSKTSALAKQKPSESEEKKKETTETKEAKKGTDTPEKNQSSTEPKAEAKQNQVSNEQKSTSEEKPSPLSASEDPNFKALSKTISATAKQQQKHEKAEDSAEKAQKSASLAQNEVLGQAQASQVEVMDKQEPEEFNAETFKKLLKSKIAAMELPKDEEEADNFEENNNISEINKAAVGDVSTEKNKATSPVQKTSDANPDVNAEVKRQVAVLPEPSIGKTPQIQEAGKAMPPPRNKSDIEAPIKKQSDSLDVQMQNNGVSEEMLANSNEPTFTAALAEKKTSQEQSEQGTHDFRAQEGEQLVQAKEAAQQETSSQSQAMHTSRKGLLEQTNTKQKNTAKENTAKRKEVSQKIDGFYKSSKVKVENILSSLETEVAQRFAKGAEIARKAFEGHIAEEMAAYKKRNYGESWFSWKQLNRIRDAWNGLPKEVDGYYKKGREIYIDAMDQCIDGIANLVAQRLKEAKQAIAEGKRNIKEYVGSLDPDLQKIGKQAAEDIQSKFDELDNSVNATKNDLIDTLADQYAENLATVDARILTLKEKNKGFVAKAKESMGGVIKQILAFKTKLMALLGDVSDVITQIITSPISFFKNLAKGVGKGFQNFGGNIMKHMKTGLIGWLTGAMSSMNIQMPEDVFSLKGIFSLSTQILGFTWDRIRNVGVKVVGEPMVGALEKGGSMIMTLREKGVSGAWKDIKEQFTDLKETVMDSIKDMVITQVIQAGIKWMLSLLSPAGAFVKAVMAIISVVKFFMERASQIADLVKAFMDSIAAIAKGKVAAVAESIENALVKSIPVLIGLLASVLGIGGLAKKVSNIMRKIQTRIETAIKGIWVKLKKTGRKLLRKLGIGKKSKKKKDKKTGDSEVGKVVHFKEKDGEGHKLWFKDSKKGPVLMVASTPATLEDRIKYWDAEVKKMEESDELKDKANSSLGIVKSKEKELSNDALTVDQLMEKARKTKDTKDDKKADNIDNKLEKKQEKLSDAIAILFDLLGDKDGEVKTKLGQLLSTDKLNLSNHLKIKDSKNDSKLVGHRAEDTQTQKKGIIVASKGGNKYTKGITKENISNKYNELNTIFDIDKRREKIMGGNADLTPEEQLENYKKIYKLILKEIPNYNGEVDKEGVIDYREDMRKAIATKFPKIDDFFEGVTKKLYAKKNLNDFNLKLGHVVKISGTIFEEWVGITFKKNNISMQEVIFNKENLEIAGIDLKSDKSVIKGDGAYIKTKEGGENTLVETKNYEAKPKPRIIDGVKKEVLFTEDAFGKKTYLNPPSGTNLTQMKNYALIINNKDVKGYQTIDGDPKNPVSFTKMKYVFSDMNIIRAWKTSLIKEFTNKDKPLVVYYGGSEIDLDNVD